jgi:hypothetical protein
VLRNGSVPRRVRKSAVPEDGFEPSRGFTPRDFKSRVSTDSTTQATAYSWASISVSGCRCNGVVAACAGKFLPKNGKGISP